MEQYVGLDVSQKTTAICVVDGSGARVWQGECRSDPETMALIVRSRAPAAVKVAFESGPLAVWHWHRLRELGLPIVCIHARHARAALEAQVNKTDANDAHGLAQLVRSGWFRAVEVKSVESYRLRALLTTRSQLVAIRTRLYNQVRGLLKTFGIVLPAGKGGSFERLVERHVPADGCIELAIGGLMRIWREVTAELDQLNRRLQEIAKKEEICRRLMSIPGLGPTTALAFVTAIDDPPRFKHSKDVGAYLGLTPRRYQSGEIDRVGHVSKCGDRLTRSLLFEAAGVLLYRSKCPTALRPWGLALSRRAGYDKARIALARKLAVLMHRMWTNGTSFATQPACAA